MRWLLIGFLVIEFGAALSAQRIVRSPEEKSPRLPNVVLIISDDQAFGDFGFMGNPVVQTPNLDALAQRGTVFTHGYVPASVCRPSLVTLLTGLYPHQHGVFFNHPPPGFSKLTRTMDRQQYETARATTDHLIEDQATLPRMLTKAGYRCLQTGKYWEGHWSNAGFTEGMTTGRYQPNAKYGNKQLSNGDWVAHGNGDAGLAIGRQTMRPIETFLRETQANDEPAFVWYAPFLPHLPHDSPKTFFDRYDKSVPTHLRAYYAACSQFDASVGELIELTRRYQTRPTLFVLVVDNGFRPDATKPMRDGHGFNYTHRSKRSPFENGLRTPVVIYQQGVTRPQQQSCLVSSVDIVPTILEATAQIESIEVAKYPGQSLWPIATGQQTTATEFDARAVFGAVYPGDASRLGRPDLNVAYRWVRQGRFKLIVPHSQQGKIWGDYVDQVQLFDLDDDPDEQVNLAIQTEYRSRVEQLRRQLDRWWSPQTKSE
ncbi:sulfatase-like hydrolase/transferase [Roseiconus lacunae]|uniref:Sulfatase-like hydrolase/transferase n=2 Tax=Roseiconus lacunae TaxID=2605694 RepID=A0ABT7PBI7_9BACT|nr:sulfatase-like hydrolase/transferase [Roseiconus lacunae]MDM4013859.1 sulfatase-like hydrolase/transferase [Roseiconus lacunae]